MWEHPLGAAPRCRAAGAAQAVPRGGGGAAGQPRGKAEASWLRRSSPAMARVQHHPSPPSPASQTGENLPVRESEASRAVLLQFNINPTESRAAVACTNFSAAKEQMLLGTTLPSRLLAESAPISLVKQLPASRNIKHQTGVPSSRATPLSRCGGEARAIAEPAGTGGLQLTLASGASQPSSTHRAHPQLAQSFWLPVGTRWPCQL